MADKPVIFNEAQKRLLAKTTPQKFIRQRQGPGGCHLSYIQAGYVIDQLNELTCWKWSFDILDQQIGKSQIWVKGKLTIPTKNNGGEIVKTQFGGKTIVKDKKTGNALDIGNDLKAAASDALKKCASLIGIAQDVYWPDGNGEA